jgi:uncharacterized protein YkwD
LRVIGYREATLSRVRALAAALAAAAFLGSAAGAEEANAADCAGGNATPMHASRQMVARATLCLMNAERRGRGLRPLRLSPPLSVAARRHSRDMVHKRYFSHTAPNGSSVVQRIRRSGYLRSAKRWSVAENLGWGSAGEGSAGAIVRAWMNSAPHRKAILTQSYRDAGIGVVRGVPTGLPSSGATYTVDFGVKR